MNRNHKEKSHDASKVSLSCKTHRLDLERKLEPLKPVFKAVSSPTTPSKDQAYLLPVSANGAVHLGLALISSDTNRKAAAPEAKEPDAIRL